MITSMATTFAQYAYSNETAEIRSRGSKIFVGDEKLSKREAFELFNQVGGEEMGNDYLSYRRGYRVGVGLSVGGASLVAVGVPASMFSITYALAHGFAAGFSGQEIPAEVDVALYGSFGVTLAGAAMMIAGIPTACVYRHRIKKLTNEYNSTMASKPIVTFSPARSGIGIAMNF